MLVFSIFGSPNWVEEDILTLRLRLIVADGAVRAMLKLRVVIGRASKDMKLMDYSRESVLVMFIDVFLCSGIIVQVASL